MAHLFLGKKLGLKKAVISVWFRIPQASADAVPDATDLFDFPVFGNLIPILILGHQPISEIYDINTIIIGYYYFHDPDGILPDETFPVYGSEAVVRTVPMQPTCIGVRIRPGGTGVLDVHLQTSDHGSAENTQSITTGWVPILNADGVAVGIEDMITEDASYVTNAAPEYLGNSYYNYRQANPNPSDPSVAFDQWHHLLLSWDLSGGSGSHGSTDQHVNPIECIDGYSLMWCALDDVNRNGNELPAMTVASLNSPYSGPGITDFNPNAMLSYNAYNTAGLYTGSGPDANQIATFSVSFSGDLGDSVIVPSEVTYATSGGPDGGKGVPAQPLMRVELAELQIFTGIALDTSIESNRRAFVDKDGKPVDAIKKWSRTDPTSGSIALLGQPSILLHRSGNWKHGRNTGSLGIDKDGNIISSGQFAPTGMIKTWKPDPSLHGPQSPPPSKAGPVRLSRKPVPAR